MTRDSQHPRLETHQWMTYVHTGIVGVSDNNSIIPNSKANIKRRS
jgi:hypothetical protein